MKKQICGLLLLGALAITAIGGSLAWLQDQTVATQNTLAPGQVPNEIEEELDGQVKNHVTIQNLGSVDAYIRAALVVSWVDEGGNVTSTLPVPGEDFTWEITKSGWKLGADGYYYHLSPVAPGDSTGELFTACEPLVQKKGLTLSVEILGQSIQAQGTENGTPVVVTRWDSVQAVNPDLTLSIQEAAA